MAGEQPIYYVSPEDNLTNIRERLAQISASRVLLVVPRQTRLRNPSSWNLLRRYADDMNKEISVISDDHQILSLARKAQFRVGPPSPGRSSNSGRNERGTSGRRSTTNRGPRGISRFRQSEPPQQKLPSSRRAATGPDQSVVRPPLQQPAEEQETYELHISNVGEDDEPQTANWSASPSFGNDQYDAAHWHERPIDFPTASNSPVRPVERTPELEEEDLDPLSISYNYQQMQKIRQAARQKDEEEGSGEDSTSVLPDHDRMVAPDDRFVPPATEEQPAQENISQIHRHSTPLSPSLSPSSQTLEDPFYAGEDYDYRPTPLSEQLGAAPVFPFDIGEDVVDIPQYPTADLAGNGEVEYLGDIEMDKLPPPSTWEGPELEQEAEQNWQREEINEQPPAYQTPRKPGIPRRSRPLSPAAMGTEAETFNQATPTKAENEKAIEDEPTRVIRPALSLPDAAAGQSANRFNPEEPEVAAPPVILSPPVRPREQKPVDRQPTRTPARQPSGRGQPPVSATTHAPRSITRTRKPPVVTRSKQSPVAPALIAVAVLLIAGIILFIFPSADVTVTLAAQPYSWPVTVSASNSQNLTQHTVPTDKIAFTASVTKSGKASGTNTPVGTAYATGLVQFTNNGSQSVLIPMGMTVSTANNVLFATTSELLVPAGSTSPTLVQAQAPGSTGNVAASTITNVPSSSINQIAQASSIAASAVKLSVTNPSPTSGGGVGSATTVTTNDVSALQSQANDQLYKELQTWLIQKQAQGYILARPVQKSQLAASETVKATPAAGQVASSGTFNVTVSLSMQVEFVHARDLQAQAVAQYQQLNSASTLPKGTSRPPKGYEPVAGQPVQLQPKTCASSGKSSSAGFLCFTATAPVALPVTARQVQNLVSGKQVNVVRAQLANSKTGLSGIKAVKVDVHPSFWPWMPFWTQRISVHFIASTSASAH